MLKVKLSSSSVIRGLLEDYDGVKCTDGIKYDSSIIGSLPIEVEVLGFETYPLGVAIKVKKSNGAPTYINYKWCSSISDGTTRSKFLTELTLLQDTYIKVSDSMVVNVTDSNIVSFNSLPICSECGTVASTMVGGKRVCDSCLENKYAKLNGYRYTPEPLNFIGEHLPKDVDNPYHFGIEIEYGLNGKLDMAKLVMQHQDEVYIKSDGSIQGGDFHAELVSHPHTFKALMGDCYLDKISTLDSVDDRAHNGCHVHISRSAFVDNKHYAKWYFLMHEMRALNEYIGGRGLTGYCSFQPTGAIGKKQKSATGGDRGLMINETNVATIECRFFSTTKDPNEVRTSIQYLESLIKYTRYSEDTVTIQGWRDYVTKYRRKYNFLVTKLDAYGGSFNGGVTYKEPTLVRRPFNTISMMDLSKITKITTRDAVYENVTRVEARADGTLAFEYNSRNNSNRVSLHDVVEVEWEE